MSKAATVGIVIAAFTAACSSSLTPPGELPLVVADAVDDVVGSPSDPVPLAPITDSGWIDIHSLTVLRTATHLRASLELAEAPDPMAFMTYSIEIDTSGDGVSDYSLWAEYFGDGNARPGLVPWSEEESLFDEAFPGSLTVDEEVLAWILPLEFIHGESLRVVGTAQRGHETTGLLVAQDWVPDTQLNQATGNVVYSWIVVP